MHATHHPTWVWLGLILDLKDLHLIDASGLTKAPNAIGPRESELPIGSWPFMPGHIDSSHHCLLVPNISISARATHEQGPTPATGWALGSWCWISIWCRRCLAEHVANNYKYHAPAPTWEKGILLFQFLPANQTGSNWHVASWIIEVGTTPKH